jgi:hypothetical protein
VIDGVVVTGCERRRLIGRDAGSGRKATLHGFLTVRVVSDRVGESSAKTPPLTTATTRLPATPRPAGRLSTRL